jgi:plasmid maintenance system antidote protein VapI
MWRLFKAKFAGKNSGSNTPDFWLNVQRRNDIWAALHTPK